VDGWWDEIEREIRDCVKRHGTLTTQALAHRLRMSESATASVLRVLDMDDVQVSVQVSRKRKEPRAAPSTTRRPTAA
jgi:ribosomal protein S25